MERTQLVYKSLAEIIESDGLAIVTLTDQPGTRALHIICDKSMRDQLQMRAKQHDICHMMLPEVLTSMLSDYVDTKRLEITIYDIRDGQYLATLMNSDNYAIRQIRLSDAILLHVIESVPIFIDEKLMKAQSVAYMADQTKISIPINTLDDEKLEAELTRAVQEEDYRLASYIKEELNRRKYKNSN